MATAGQIATAGRIPGERIATTIVQSDSDTFTTTETVVASVTAAVVSGRTYAVRVVNARWASDTGGARVQARLREDHVNGTQLAASGLIPIVNTSSSGYPGPLMEGVYVATTTENKTFVLTGIRDGTTSGNCRLLGSAIAPTLLYVDYISG